MKWYNKNRTVCLNLDLVVYWNYTSKEEIAQYTASAKKIREQDPTAFLPSPLENTRIEIYGGGGPFRFNGNDADEIYNMLTYQKEIL